MFLDYQDSMVNSVSNDHSRGIMKKFAIGLMLLFAVGAALPETSQAEDWIALTKNVHLAYYDRDSILYPHIKVYDFGLFTMGKVDKDIMRVWTKLYFKDSSNPRVLYEVKFSTRVFRILHAVDQFGNQLPVYDVAFKPILPGSLENDLYETVKPEANLDENKYPFADTMLDSGD
jgi:hypothetical protein